MIYYPSALSILVPDAKIEYVGVNPDYDDIVWLDSRSKPSREECNLAWPDIQNRIAEEQERIKKIGKNPKETKIEVLGDD
jgi:hypothetical protein